MIPPTSIDGTDITGATIDGTDVQEITVDGDVVFSAQTLPVAYSNLVAWYPFDAAEYGGSNADDVTAIIGGSGDDTAYDGTVLGNPSHVSGGFYDINAGANSGAFDFDDTSPEELIETNSNLGGVFTGDYTFMCWANADKTKSSSLISYNDGNFDKWTNIGFAFDQLTWDVDDGSDKFDHFESYTSFTDVHVALSYDSSTDEVKAYKNAGNPIATGTEGQPHLSGNEFYIGSYFDNRNASINGTIDDVRVYNTVLSQSQIQQIYDNTDPAQNP